ncbi:uncharacterized protein [Blastocystis hominis]|uniref:DJ-1/PfpI domain-containing protein n=1 Tax=Blastocystis hominis TaxID=12968 RepID=D8LVY8_BLAHO|nr:uncharacterized protein [Blastocystis hominis]XP_012894085.1 uncharacterized protein [Blastocystis hominis]CBK19977.2 unnamed protein product [Blastocystis hominis]CBK20037.2 unnamed protein product [Blastocystis hominis]|eukprot:XP_012894025.1 uncharacterized protein [Blastocystis hominis]
MPRALVAVSEGSEELETIGIVDVLRRGKVNVTLASVDHQKTVKCSKGTIITADALLKDVKDETFDAIVLPGGLPGAEHLRDSKTLSKLLEKQKEEGRIYAAICASPAVVFASHNLLEGVKATCYPSFKEDIEHYVNDKVVVSGNCITSQGPGTVAEFALQLVESLCGKATRASVAKGMIYNSCV